ncbi:MAG: GAF domain-containing protein, partial [Planctomycetota bacterium]
MERDAIRQLSAALAAAPDATALRRELVERVRDAIGGSAASLEDASADEPSRSRDPAFEPSGRALRVPIAGLGAIRVELPAPCGDPSSILRELPVLQAIAELGVRLQLGREHAELRQRVERRVCGAFTHVSTLEEFSSALESLATEFFDAEYSALYFLDPDSGRIRLMASTGLSEAERVEAERTARGRHPGHVLRTGEIIEVADTDADADHRTVTEPGRRVAIRSRVYLPVRSSGKVVGAIGMASPRPNAFGPFHRDTLEFLSNLSGLAYGRLQAESANVRRSHLVEASAIAGERLLAATDWRQAVHAALGVLGSALGASTLAAVQVVSDQDGAKAHEEYAWQPYFGEPWMRGLELSRPPAESRFRLGRGEPWHIGSGSAGEAVMAKPIVVDGSLWGVLALELPPERNGEFDRDERLALRAFSNSIAVAIARERLDATARTRQRMEAVGALAAGIAHDFNNLLWPIILYSEMLERGFPGDQRALAMLRDMQQAARRASELVQQVLAISRHRDRSLELVGLPDIVSNLA